MISFVPFGQRHYVAELSNTAGLQKGEEVQIAGIGVGEVRDISLDGQKVRVDFTVDKDARSYLPSMFGRNGFAIVGDIGKLPQALPAIYRGLTR